MIETQGEDPIMWKRDPSPGQRLLGTHTDSEKETPDPAEDGESKLEVNSQRLLRGSSLQKREGQR